MSLIHPISTLRRKSHVFTRLELRDEAAYSRRLIPWLALVDVSFSLVDWISVQGSHLWVFFALRSAGVVLSYLLWHWLRGRARYGLRLFLVLAPYIFTVEYIMVANGLVMSPYFAGMSLVMITSTMLFPMRFRIASFIYGACAIPIVGLALVPGMYPAHQALQQVLMTLGTAVVCAVNSGFIWAEFRLKLEATEALARDRGRRGKVIQEKAAELAKRQIFESQFSPQVVGAVLKNQSTVRGMVRRRIVNIVIDIQESTKKANSLVPDRYKQVIEEVLDVFSAACLKWDITLDKFTGDGLQAFAGAPFSDGDDLKRALLACRDCMSMLDARQTVLEGLWGDPLNVRYAVCQGEALVGFVGRGVFKSYTAIGDMVSFTHRLSSVPEPGKIAVFLWDDPLGAELAFPGFRVETRQVTNLKGFGDRRFRVSILVPQQDAAELFDAGRCLDCDTPLVTTEDARGLPMVFCSACSATGQRAA